MLRKIAFGLAATAMMSSAQAQEVVLKVAHFLPPMSTMHSRFIVPWCDKIEAESKGRMKCQIYPAMQLGGTPPQLLSQVRDGVADIVWTISGYTPGRFPISEVFELPFMTTTHEASARAVWDFIDEHAASEFEGVKRIANWVVGPYVIHLRDKDLNTIEDFRGMKIRAPSRLGNRMLTALGATPVGMPVPQISESLSRGVIDAAIVPWEVVPATKAHELTKFHVEVSGGRSLTTATSIYVMNQKRYDSLPPELKKVIDDNSGREVSAWVAAEFKVGDEGGRAAALGRGNKITEIPADEVKRWKDASQPVVDEWIAEVTSKGHDGRKLYERAVELVEKHSRN
ncbi:TRAP transporter substrate-binding protein [Thauera phenylacetica]|jgi:TRAP-type C4-dicarboxylate transport system substrate-binding protein|uniref:TRAP transporter substrate-binding protein n=1 Tax=Thauera phenylacetica TaxID=164400 RepID=UPI002CD8037E|nr:TRAP transporter substrate-binding protein [Thauera phenylacetica]